MKRIYATLAAAAFSAVAIMAAEPVALGTQLSAPESGVAPKIMPVNAVMSKAQRAELAAKRAKTAQARKLRKAEENVLAFDMDNIAGDFINIYSPFFNNLLNMEMSEELTATVLDDGETIEFFGLANVHPQEWWLPTVQMPRGIYGKLTEEGNLVFEFPQYVGTYTPASGNTTYDIVAYMLAPAEDGEGVDLFEGTMTMTQEDGIFMADTDFGFYTGIMDGEDLAGGWGAVVSPAFVEPNGSLEIVNKKNENTTAFKVYSELVEDDYESVLNLTSIVPNLGLDGYYNASFPIAVDKETDEPKYAVGQDVVVASEMEYGNDGEKLGIKEYTIGSYCTSNDYPQENPDTGEMEYVTNEDVFTPTLFAVGIDMDNIAFPTPDCVWNFKAGFTGYCSGIVYATPGDQEGYYSYYGIWKPSFITKTESRKHEVGIEKISANEAAANGSAVYYNLQGVRVDNPTNGVYIKREGSKATKVLVK